MLQAALRLSPAAATRVPAGYREVVEREASSPDSLDKECIYHSAMGGDRDPAKEADKSLERILNGKGLEKAYTRAQALGRYLHFVADAIMPTDFQAQSGKATTEFFANKNFVIFREKVPLARPLAPALRERAQTVRWDKSDSLSTATYRLAINSIADALLLLPPEAGETVPPDEGPTIFVVDRLDTGLGASRVTGYSYTGSVQSGSGSGSSSGGYGTGYVGTAGGDTRLYSEKRSGDATKGASSFVLSEKPGLHVVEWVEKKLGGGVARVRVLLFNNEDKCATKISLRVPTAWEEGTKIPIALGPRSVAVVEIDAPAGMPIAAILRTFIIKLVSF